MRPPKAAPPTRCSSPCPTHPSSKSSSTVANHHQFQQPTGADSNSLPPGINRVEQQRIAIELTLAFLDETFGIERD